MLIVAAIIIAFILLLASYPLIKWLQIDYRFAAPDSWAESCLGGGDAADEYLDWGDAGAPAPDVSRLEPSYNSYVCQWRWQEGESKQELTIEIEVNDDDVYEPRPPGDGWSTDYESLNGWEHGTCQKRIGIVTHPEYQCTASDSNLLLTVSNRNLSEGTENEPKYFGPNGKSVEDLTVELGELVRETFAR
ncbi:hypothetical protein [Glycomyces sp. NPDC047010]|uniref:hypothetical protein n=1 Tax=Glycomyces sp. NPDC047010 TaxID=3155023 RepID=UPI0033C3D5FE